MKICNGCNSENFDDSLFCYGCGQKLEHIKSQNLKSDVASDFRAPKEGELLFETSWFQNFMNERKEDFNFLAALILCSLIFTLVFSSIIWILFSLYKGGFNSRFRFTFASITDKFYPLYLIAALIYGIYHNKKRSLPRKVNYINGSLILDDNKCSLGLISSISVLNSSSKQIRLIFIDDYIENTLAWGLQDISDNYAVQKKYLIDKKHIDVSISDNYKGNVSELVVFLTQKATEIRADRGY